MRILLITDGIWPFVIGGMEKHSYYLVKYLASPGVHIDLVHPRLSQQQRADFERLFPPSAMDNISLRELSSEQFNTPFPGHYIAQNYLYSKRAFESLTDLPQPDFIYAKGLTGWYFSLHRRAHPYWSAVPLGVNAHGYEMFQKPGSVKTWLSSNFLKYPFYKCVRGADFVFSYGARITDLLIDRVGVPQEKIIEIPAGIEAEWLAEQPAGRGGERLRFIFLGRYERRKGIEELSKVIQEHRWTDSAEFHFIGDIPPAARIAAENVCYHGKISDVEAIRSLLRSSQVLLVPSHSEGMPNVILEGMASGCAVIATDVGAVSLMVDDTNGWLIQPRSSTQLVTAINSALGLSAETLLERQWASIKKVRDEFGWKYIAEKTHKALREACLAAAQNS